jgi:NADPH-dependent dioxygenase
LECEAVSVLEGNGFQKGVMREKNAEVLVIGAGPVGLLAGLVLAEGGIDVKIMDREEQTATRSYACALHSHTLKLLDRLGLASGLLKRGRRVRSVAFYDGQKQRAELDLAKLGADFPFLLVLPQSTLEEALENRLRERAPSALFWNHRFDEAACEQESVLATVERLGGTATGYIVPHWETVVLKRSAVRARFLVGADGHNSLVRQRLGIEYAPAGGRQEFAVFECASDSEPPDEARIVLDDSTANVLWPLPANRFRWTFQLSAPGGPAERADKDRSTLVFDDNRRDEALRRLAQRLCRHRAPWFSANLTKITWCTRVSFESRLAKRFGQDRCWLAGDAAHQTSPIGMQSMNAGLCEADALATTLTKVLRDGASLDLLAAYNRHREKEWRHLLGFSGGPAARSNTNAWVREHRARILPCIPASGGDLIRLADQLALDVG